MSDTIILGLSPWLAYIVVFLALALGAVSVVNGAIALGRWLRVPPNIVGLFTISIGASLPELMVSAQLANRSTHYSTPSIGKPDLAFATADGSFAVLTGTSLFDLALILGLMILVQPFVVSGRLRATVVTVAAFLATAAVSFSFFFLVFRDEWEQFAIMMLIGAGLYLLVLLALRIGGRNREEEDEFPAPVDAEGQSSGSSAGAGVLYIIGGFAVLFLASMVLGYLANEAISNAADNAAWVASIFFIFGIGCAIPEVVSALAALVRRQPHLLRGGLLGSTAINFLIILPAIILVLIGGNVIKESFVAHPINAYAALALAFITGMFALFLVFWRRVPRWLGPVLILIYIGFVVDAYRTWGTPQL